MSHRYVSRRGLFRAFVSAARPVTTPILPVHPYLPARYLMRSFVCSARSVICVLMPVPWAFSTGMKMAIRNW